MFFLSLHGLDRNHVLAVIHFFSTSSSCQMLGPALTSPRPGIHLRVGTFGACKGITSPSRRIAKSGAERNRRPDLVIQPERRGKLFFAEPLVAETRAEND